MQNSTSIGTELLPIIKKVKHTNNVSRNCSLKTILSMKKFVLHKKICDCLLVKWENCKMNLNLFVQKMRS